MGEGAFCNRYYFFSQLAAYFILPCCVTRGAVCAVKFIGYADNRFLLSLPSIEFTQTGNLEKEQRVKKWSLLLPTSYP